MYTITAVAQNELLSYIKYTVTNRALPSMIDSLKPSQRFFLYSCLKNAKKEYKKVSALAGILSDYGYAHGEVSAENAGKLMAAEWANNVCLIAGRGSFGTRQVQEAGASRYIYAKVSDNFFRHFSDMELCPEHDDPEHEPPAYYLSVLPLLLINGTRGVATGFATHILPREQDDVILAIMEYLTDGEIKTSLRIKFPDFRGTVEYDEKQEKYFARGLWEKQSKTTLYITEIPYSFDRESYIKVLDTLEDKGLIVSYEDQTSADGFRFMVKLKQATSAKWSDAQIVKNFKLEKPYTENITVIGPNDDLREYTDPKQLIMDFVDFRLSILQKRIDLKIVNTTEYIRRLTVRMEFIMAVLDNKIQFKNKKKDQIAKQILSVTSALESDIDWLLAINMLHLTKEKVDELKAEIKEAKAQLAYWKKTTPRKQYETDIEGILG